MNLPTPPHQLCAPHLPLHPHFFRKRRHHMSPVKTQDKALKNRWLLYEHSTGPKKVTTIDVTCIPSRPREAKSLLGLGTPSSQGVRGAGGERGDGEVRAT